ncbi:Uncharacterized protein FWK35_00028618 [Aphis craccivora]|uniref:Uncharacterized protein n=1 Tax=Aphis craccivora TaxID=307492 RepID=A0A6G0XMX6_APHCR|nr:Uncharacterized protein FWK35_00028618 [Aphis craccivora]
MQETRRLEAVEINTGYYRKITGRESSAGKAYIRQKGSGKTEREHRHTDFHAGFAPKWWGPVTLSKQVGKGVFLTDQQPPRKIHVSCLKRAPHNDITK